MKMTTCINVRNSLFFLFAIVSCAKGAGYFSGGLLLGFYVRQYCRESLHTMLMRWGQAPMLGYIATVVSVDPRRA